MKPGAIIVVGADAALTREVEGSGTVVPDGLTSEPLPFVEVAGRSTLKRMVETGT